MDGPSSASRTGVLNVQSTGLSQSPTSKASCKSAQARRRHSASTSLSFAHSTPSSCSNASPLSLDRGQAVDAVNIDEPPQGAARL